MNPPHIPKSADERTMLNAFLDYYRAAMFDIADGLDADQMRQRLEPSTLTIGGLLHHLAVVEDWWFNEVLADNPASEPWASAPWDEDRDWDFTVSAELDPDLIRQRYHDAIDTSRELEAAVDSLDFTTVKERDGEPFSLRWILVHMIEETARHAGHGDLIRESIDGKTASS
jgi:uncharacterized damage-inducible protein DinB